MLFGFFYLASIALAYPYTWKFENNPTQCQTLKVSIQADTNSYPPYRLLLVPFGTWSGKYEVPRPAPQVFTFSPVENNRWTLDFPLKYPAGSQLVATVGDAHGFATGGTSLPWTVRDSTNSSCFDNTWSGQDKWPYFYLSPEAELYSCETTNVSWRWPNSNITGKVHFTALYPGGQSLNISISSNFSIETPSSGAPEQGFSWTVPFPQDADVILISGDDSSIEAPGGLETHTVKPPRDPSKVECPLNMPTLTPGVPAGGDPNVDLDKAQNLSIKIAAVLGGIAGLLLLIGAILGIWFFVRKSKSRKAQRAGPHPPLSDDEDVSYIIHTGPIEPFTSLSPMASSAFSSSRRGDLSPAREMSFAPPVLRKSNLPGQEHQTSSQVHYVRHRDSEDKLLLPPLLMKTVELPPDYNSNRSLPSSSSSGLTASDLSPIHYEGDTPRV